MILSKGRKIVDFHGKGGTQLQKVFGKGGVLLWERGGLPQPPDGVVLTDIRVRITISNLNNGYVSLGWSPTNTVDKQLWIDWGDDTKYITKDYSVFHNYKKSGEYIVHIQSRQTKTVGFLSFIGGSHVSEFLPGSHLGSDLVSCNYLANKHGNENEPQVRIKRFPSGFFEPCINLEELNALVMGNPYFNNIQQGIFKNCIKLKKMSSNFSIVPNLTNVPDDLYPHPNIYTIASFVGTPISKIPRRIATVNPFIGVAFSEFTRPGIPNVYIDEIPADYFNCVSSITTLNTIDGVFADLTMVTDIPPTIFHCIPKVTGFVSTFARSGITSIPQNLFANNPNVTDFRGTFDNCISVTSPVPRLWETHPNANGTDCFRGCVNAANYSEIPDIWK